MAVFIVDVLDECRANRFLIVTQASPARHHQRNGMAHVMERLGEKKNIALQIKTTGGDCRDHRS